MVGEALDRPTSAKVHDKRDHKKNQEDIEQYLRDAGCGNSNAREPQYAGDDSDNEENQSPIEHVFTLRELNANGSAITAESVKTSTWSQKTPLGRSRCRSVPEDRHPLGGRCVE